jgi:1-acyl-sn-glycerol-3-phosphate acyltransferase
MQRLQPGSIAMAVKAGAPIIPCGLAGTFQALPRQGGLRLKRVAVEVGAPLVFPEAQAMLAAGRPIPRRMMHRMTDTVGDAIATLRRRAAEP